jgi:hypothetical protein
MQAQRFELKYLVPGSITTSIRAFVSSYLELDPFAANSDHYSYANHSIYLDSGSLHTFHAKLQGHLNRFKLRLRFYDEKPDSPVFLEVKRRHKDIIQKTRCAIPRHSLLDTLAGDTSFVKPTEINGHAAFCKLMYQIDATPRAHVAYDREAWSSRDDNSVRVTIDRNVRAEPCFDYGMTTAMDNPVSVFGTQNVLELKFTNRAPDWIRELVRVFHLSQSGGAKYAGGHPTDGRTSLRGASPCFGQPRRGRHSPPVRLTHVQRASPGRLLRNAHRLSNRGAFAATVISMRSLDGVDLHADAQRDVLLALVCEGAGNHAGDRRAGAHGAVQ